VVGGGQLNWRRVINVAQPVWLPAAVSHHAAGHMTPPGVRPRAGHRVRQQLRGPAQSRCCRQWASTVSTAVTISSTNQALAFAGLQLGGALIAAFGITTGYAGARPDRHRLRVY
jgi:hypothetical protein